MVGEALACSTTLQATSIASNIKNFCLYSTLLPQAGRQHKLCWRTSRESHPSGERPKLRTGVPLWADGILAEQGANPALA